MVRKEDGNIVHCSVVVKVDTGPGRLGASLENVEFRRKMREKGVVILLGLPNSTSVSQELDWLFQTFKPYTRERTLDIFSKKVKDRANEKRRRYENGENTE